jgi:hypothetical protein
MSARISSEAQQAIDKIYNNAEMNNCALILKCNTQAQTVEIEEELTDASVEDVKEALPDGSPRLVFYRVKRPDFPSSLMFIWYNPLDLLPTMKRTYQMVVESLEKSYKALRIFQINNPEDFKQEWLNSRGFGLTGKASNDLVPQNKEDIRPWV